MDRQATNYQEAHVPLLAETQVRQRCRAKQAVRLDAKAIQTANVVRKVTTICGRSKKRGLDSLQKLACEEECETIQAEILLLHFERHYEPIKLGR